MDTGLHVERMQIFQQQEFAVQNISPSEESIVIVLLQRIVLLLVLVLVIGGAAGMFIYHVGASLPRHELRCIVLRSCCL